jgi:hypothetical protein
MGGEFAAFRNRDQMGVDFPFECILFTAATDEFDLFVSGDHNGFREGERSHEDDRQHVMFARERFLQLCLGSHTEHAVRMHSLHRWNSGWQRNIGDRRAKSYIEI